MASIVRVSYTFKFTTGLRAYHVYRNTENWKPFLEQKITFKREKKNAHDRFAVVGMAMLPGKLAPVIVGHIPRELSRYVWFAILTGAEFNGKVKNTEPKLSPLVQGLLEIAVEVSVTWDDQENLQILEQKVKEVEYPIDGEYVDDSKSILKEILKKDNEDSSESEEEEEGEQQEEEGGHR